MFVGVSYWKAQTADLYQISLVLKQKAIIPAEKNMLKRCWKVEFLSIFNCSRSLEILNLLARSLVFTVLFTCNQSKFRCGYSINSPWRNFCYETFVSCSHGSVAIGKSFVNFHNCFKWVCLLKDRNQAGLRASLILGVFEHNERVMID